MKFTNGYKNKRFPLKQNKKSRKIFLLEGMAGATISALLSSVFLAKFLDFLGISNSVAAIILQIPLFVAPVQLLSPLFFERFTKKLPYMRFCILTMRAMLIFSSFMAMAVTAPALRAAIMGVVFIGGYLISNFADPAWVDYQASIVPEKLRISFMGIRNPMMLFTGALSSLVMSFVLDHFINSGRQKEGFIVVFVSAAFFWLIDLFVVCKLREPVIRREKKKINLKDVITKPLKNKRFREVIAFGGIYQFSLQFANAFFSIYLVSVLKVPLAVATGLGVLSNLVRIIAGFWWGRASKRKSPIKIIIMSLIVLSATYSLWFFATGPVVFMYAVLILVNITAAIGLTGLTAGMFAVNTFCAPKEGRTLYFAFNSCFGNLVGFIASLVGATVNRAIGEYEFLLFGMRFHSVQILFLIEGFMMLVTAFYAAKVFRNGKHCPELRGEEK